VPSSGEKKEEFGLTLPSRRWNTKANEWEIRRDLRLPRGRLMAWFKKVAPALVWKMNRQFPKESGRLPLATRILIRGGPLVLSLIRLAGKKNGDRHYKVRKAKNRAAVVKSGKRGQIGAGGRDFMGMQLRKAAEEGSRERTGACEQTGLNSRLELQSSGKQGATRR